MCFRKYYTYGYFMFLWLFFVSEIRTPKPKMYHFKVPYCCIIQNNNFKNRFELRYRHTCAPYSFMIFPDFWYCIFFSIALTRKRLQPAFRTLRVSFCLWRCSCRYIQCETWKGIFRYTFSFDNELVNRHIPLLALTWTFVSENID